jgi:hypothetical protein
MNKGEVFPVVQKKKKDRRQNKKNEDKVELELEQIGPKAPERGLCHTR